MPMISNTSRSSFAPGQQWISEAEPELGIGTLIFCDKRTIKLHFPAHDCHRHYSRTAPPVKRVIFKIGERLHTRDNREILVEEVRESKSLIFYCQGKTRVCEKELSHTLGFSLPQERLLAGLAGPSQAFDLRQDLLMQRAAYEKSLARGFLGGQIQLIPHQFYIAGEITSRALPRVMLSDETGLGKTIEACLILHQLLISHCILRVLVIVPESLVHQWFVELYRKFNLSFRIFNTDHYLETARTNPGINPFLDDQQGIASLDFVMANEKIRDQILGADWDMVVMDEAHHLLDPPGFHGFMQALGKKTQGLMLLTATPEQMGVETHFSQLQLLDPDRYFDLAVYLAETRTYGDIALQVNSLIQEKKDPAPLLDTHGPGRVIFRNTRSLIQGFPKRTACLLPLQGTRQQIQWINQEYAMPHALPEKDLTQDPRIACLAELVRRIKPEKILVICSSKAQVEAVERSLKAHVAIDLAKFDETMTLLQRDRNAAWFSREEGARLLVCSEIGSEGRNFQFVHHLFLFDLPKNPELLEQRIGRVDRIGQQHEITLHVPYVQDSVGEVLALWYMKGLNLLEQNINGAHTIFKRFETALEQLLQSTMAQGKVSALDLGLLMKKAAEYTAKTQEQLNLGKNILVEMNSFKPGPAQNLINAIQEMDQDPGLEHLLERVLDHYGIALDRTTHGPGEKIVRLSLDHPVDEEFPALPWQDKAITFDRQTAIAREDLVFFSWDHPFVNQAFDFFLTQGQGTCATARITDGAGPGLFLESIFVLACPAPALLNMERFLSAEPLRVLINHLGENCSNKNPLTLFQGDLEPDSPDWFETHDRIKEQLILELLAKSHCLAQKQADQLLESCRDRIHAIVGKEVERLKALQKINPGIREREISTAQKQLDRLISHLSQARLHLDAVRLIRVDPGSAVISD